MSGVASGPRVVALGGGHGLAATLAAVRSYAGDVTAVVSAADDGGSSGRLRETYGIPPPGDLRRCLVALGDRESLWGRAFEHRFDGGDLGGHPVGNLVIAGLANAAGDFTKALEEAGRLVGAQGRVLPATLTPVVLSARAREGEVTGQVAVARAHHITRVWVSPADAETPSCVLDAIAAADQIVIGPGSLYTSLLAVVAVPAIGDALKRAAAPKVYVCNLRPQVPETEDYDAATHLRALVAHGLDVDLVVWDPTTLAKGEPGGVGEAAFEVGADAEFVAQPGLGQSDGSGHDPKRLGEVLAGLVG